MNSLARTLRVPALAAATLILLGQAAAYYLLPKTEAAFDVRPLSAFPAELGDWHLTHDTPIEKEVQDVLRADDSMNRIYASPRSPVPLSIFVAFFKTQKTGVAPHSPKNCLPGSGWAPQDAGEATIDIPGAEPITVNRYIVARGTEKTLVYYWYQTPRRVVASEYLAKIWLVLDSLRYRRSDTSIVRVLAPVPDNGDQSAAERAAQDFTRTIYPALVQHLPR